MLLTHILLNVRFNLNTQVIYKKSPQTNCHLIPELVRERELPLKDTYKRKSAYLNMMTKTKQT